MGSVSKQFSRGAKSCSGSPAQTSTSSVPSEDTSVSGTSPGKLPLPAILEVYCRHLQATRTYKSWKNDVSRLRVIFGPVCPMLEARSSGGLRQAQSDQHIDKYFGKHIEAERLDDVTPQMINHFLAEREEQGNWAPKTVNLARQVLHSLFAYAARQFGFQSSDRRYPNPADGVARRREPAPQIRFLSLGQIDEQLSVLEGHSTIRAMVATYIYAGLRREEACWLTRDDVDLDQRVIRVRAKTVGDESWQPKTKRNRIVPISDALLVILSTYRSKCESAWFFSSPRGRRWNTDNLSQKLARLNRSHGLDWTCLDFRHTFGSQLAQKGESLYKIATLMGNSPDICRRHYAALIPEKMRDVVEFRRSEEQQPPDEDTKAMLREILRRLR